MSEPQNALNPEVPFSGVNSLNAVNVIVEGGGDTTIRRMTPEEIAAMKRFWERQGRKPPPPWDKA